MIKGTYLVIIIYCIKGSNILERMLRSTMIIIKRMNKKIIMFIMYFEDRLASL